MCFDFIFAQNGIPPSPKTTCICTIYPTPLLRHSAAPSMPLHRSRSAPDRADNTVHASHSPTHATRSTGNTTRAAFSRSELLDPIQLGTPTPLALMTVPNLQSTPFPFVPFSASTVAVNNANPGHPHRPGWSHRVIRIDQAGRSSMRRRSRPTATFCCGGRDTDQSGCFSRCVPCSCVTMPARAC